MAIQTTGFQCVVLREVRRIISRPLYLMIMVVLPLVSFGLLIGIFFKGAINNLPVAVYDADHSALSRRLTRMIDATASMEVAASVTDMQSGQSLLRSGGCYALIVLKPHLQKDVQRGIAPHVVAYFNNTYLIAGSVLKRDVTNVVATLSAGLDHRLRMSQCEIEAAAMAHIEPIRVQTHILFNPYLNYQYFLTSSLLPTMLQIFILLTTVYAFGSELKLGSASRWLKCAGEKVWVAVVGKAAPYTLVFLIIGGFMNTLLFLFLGVPLKGSACLIWAALLLMIIAYQTVGLMLVAFTANMRLGLSLASFYASTAFAFAGVTFPIISMPLPAQIWGTILPLTHYLKILVDQALRGAPAAVSLPAIEALTLFIVVVFPLAMLPMPRLMRYECFWGKM